MNREYDLIIIGGGLAGIGAALSAKNDRNRVLIIAKGFGSFYYGSGVIDLLGYIKGKLIARPQEYMGSVPNFHPYRIIGKHWVHQALNQFVHQMEATNDPFIHKDNEENMLLPTALGSIRPTYLAPLGLAQGDMKSGGRIKIFGVQEFHYFSPRVVASNLAKELDKRGIDSEISWDTLQLGSIRPGPVSAYDLALWLDHPGNVKEMIKQVLPQLAQEERIGFPAILGLKHHQQILAQIEEATGRTVFEIPTIPPSVPGIRLHQSLARLMRERGIDWITGYPAVDAVIKGDFVHSVQIGAPGKNISFRGKKYILATGGLGSEGLVSGPGWIKEPLFHLPVHHHDQVEKWSSAHFWEEQPYACFGIRVDQKMRPVDDQGRICFANLYAAGSILAFFDGVAEKSTAGIDIVTGFIAGKESGGES